MKIWQDNKKFAAALAVCIVLTAVLLIAAALFLIGLLSRPVSQKTPPEQETEQSEALAMPEDFLPQYLFLGKKPPEAVFMDESGAAVSVEQLATNSDRGVWLMFWASWCPDCDRQFAQMRELEALAETYGVVLVLVDRLNPDRESVSTSEAKRSEYGVFARNVYDDGETCYRAWGMREIPGTVMLDSRGRVAGYYSGVISAGNAQGMLKRLCDGRGAQNLAFILNRMSDGRGGVYTSTRAGGASPSGTDILSESQGLMMSYAVGVNDRQLFDRTWDAAVSKLMTQGLTAWYAREDGEKADANALLDDLRLWYALRQAGERWGDEAYRRQADALRESLKTACRNSEGHWVDFIVFSSGKQAETIALCYLDIEILEAMAQDDPELTEALEHTKQVLLSGRVSDAFPLYFSRYDYQKGRYAAESLNTSEALYTLWNLSRAGLLPNDALDWVRQRVRDGTLAARYDLSGQIVPGYEYHSTAAYGLAALLAWEAGDEEMFEMAVRRMERLYVLDADSPFLGAYCQKGAGAYAFDQLIPLLVNKLWEE